MQARPILYCPYFTTQAAPISKGKQDLAVAASVAYEPLSLNTYLCVEVWNASALGQPTLTEFGDWSRSIPLVSWRDEGTWSRCLPLQKEPHQFWKEHTCCSVKSFLWHTPGLSVHLITRSALYRHHPLPLPACVQDSGSLMSEQYCGCCTVWSPWGCCKHRVGFAKGQAGNWAAEWAGKQSLWEKVTIGKGPLGG